MIEVLDRLLWAPRPSRLYRYLHSRLRRLDIDREAAAEVMSQYGLAAKTACRNLSMGWRNRSLVVNTPAGRKVLKLYRSNWPLGTVLCEHSVLTRLAQLNIPASRLVPTSDGRTYILRSAGIYAMFDYVEGQSLSLTFMPRALRTKLVVLSGKLLAQIHRALDGFVPHGQHHIGFDSYTGERRPSVSWFEGRVNELKEKSRHLSAGPAGDHARRLAQVGAYVADTLYRLDEVLRGTDIPRVVIHGDYGFHNLVFQDSSTITALDFELARLEWRLSEIVSTLPRYWRSDDSEDLAAARLLLSAYEAVFPMSPEEWHLFPQVWAYQNLRAAVQYWNSYFEVSQDLRRLVRARDALARAGCGQYIVDQLRNASARSAG